MKRFTVLLLLSLPALAGPEDYFSIQVVDEETGRGVPLVQLETTDKARHYTDSAGFIALNEPGLMGETVWFTVSSHGYEFKADGFGMRGTALKVVPGGKAVLKIKRLNIAERLYRVTGRGIYRDSILLGHKPPIAQAALNGKVMGQDSTLTAIYNGKLYWFWGDTSRPGYPLGNFFMSGATSALPGSGGPDPSVGVDLTYFTDPKTGFARSMVPLGKGQPTPVWADAFLTVKDDSGKERLFAHYNRVNQAMAPVERGLIVYDDAKEVFVQIGEVPLKTKLAPSGHPFRVNIDGQEYFYFPAPYPVVRVKNDWKSLCDLAAYEGFTCLKDGSEFSKSEPALDRDPGGKLVWKWRKATAILGPEELENLIKSKKITREECPFALRNAEDGKPFRLHTSSVYWNAFLKRWLMIGGQIGGDSMLGEIWLATAHSPEGPWLDARKVATHAKKHDNNDLYNPVQHPYFAQENGKLIYFEGTFVNTFSGNPHATPIYDYNQLMYRVDLSNPRLKLPEPPAGNGNGKQSSLGW